MYQGFAGGNLRHRSQYLDHRVGGNTIGEVVGQTREPCQPPKPYEAIRSGHKVFTMRRVLEESFQKLKVHEDI